MKSRVDKTRSDQALEATQELVDAVAAAVDQNRTDEVARVREALEAFGLGQAFADELRLIGWASDNPEVVCWACQEVAA
jgi:hypothetical protein